MKDLDTGLCKTCLTHRLDCVCGGGVTLTDSRRKKVVEARQFLRSAVTLLAHIASLEKVEGNEEAYKTAMCRTLIALQTLTSIVPKKTKSYIPTRHRTSPLVVKLINEADLTSVVCIMGKIHRQKLAKIAKSVRTHTDGFSAPALRTAEEWKKLEGTRRIEVRKI